MTVKKLKGKRTLKRKTLQKPSRTVRQAVGVGSLQLPTAKKKKNENLMEYTILIYGREKIGKTTLFSSFPDALFLATEPGTKGLEIFEFNHEDGGVKNWEIFRRAVDLLEGTDDFSNVVIDTVDRAYDMCLDWTCEKHGIEYPGTDAAGKEDFGKSWRAIKDEFLVQIHRILQTGRGLCFTSHAKEETIKTRSGISYDRIYPTMSGQARKVIEALVDFFFYAEYVRDRDGNTRRILITQGDETVWAGARASMGENFPRFLPIEKEGGFETIKRAFEGKYHGINPDELIPAKNTMGPAKVLINKAKARKERST